MSACSPDDEPRDPHSVGRADREHCPGRAGARTLPLTGPAHLEISSKLDLFPGRPELTFRASPSFLHVWMTRGVELDELIQLFTGETALGTQ